MSSPEAALFRALTRAVFETQNALLRHGDLINAPFGQTSARWRVMLHISQGNPSVAGIARATGYSRQAVQRLANTLVADRLATYEPDPSDRRTQAIRLSERGQAVFAAMEDSFDIWSKRNVAQLPEEVLTDATELLLTIKRVIEQDCEQIRETRRMNNEG